MEAVFCGTSKTIWQHCRPLCQLNTSLRFPGHTSSCQCCFRSISLLPDLLALRWLKP